LAYETPASRPDEWSGDGCGEGCVPPRRAKAADLRRAPDRGAARRSPSSLLPGHRHQPSRLPGRTRIASERGTPPETAGEIEIRRPPSSRCPVIAQRCSDSWGGSSSPVRPFVRSAQSLKPKATEASVQAPVGSPWPSNECWTDWAMRHDAQKVRGSQPALRLQGTDGRGDRPDPRGQSQDHLPAPDTVSELTGTWRHVAKSQLRASIGIAATFLGELGM